MSGAWRRRKARLGTRRRFKLTCCSLAHWMWVRKRFGDRRCFAGSRRGPRSAGADSTVQKRLPGAALGPGGSESYKICAALGQGSSIATPSTALTPPSLKWLRGPALRVRRPLRLTESEMAISWPYGQPPPQQQGFAFATKLLERLAPRAGLEPATIRLTVECSTS